MIEIRIHGRGGQGNVVAAYLLATTAINEGWHAQAFPAFGAERRGAPVVAFVRINHQPIKRRCQVESPDFLIVQDEALMNIPGITDGLKSNGCILVNSEKSREQYAAEHIASQVAGETAIDTSTDINEQLNKNLITLPATQLAQQYLGRPVPNTALLSAFLSLTGLLKHESLIQSLRERFSGDVLDKNISLINAAENTISANLWKTRANA